MEKLKRNPPAAVDLLLSNVRVYEPRRSTLRLIRQHWLLYVMLLPALLLLVLFQLYPLWGLSIAFVDYNIAQGVAGSSFVGLQNFEDVFSRPETFQILRNTVVIAVGKIIVGQIAAVVFALALNEVKAKRFKRTVQTLTTLPHFLSWVIIGGVMVNILASGGLVNDTLKAIGLQPIGFFRDNATFPWTLILSDVWKGFGFGAVIYLAALTQISPELYEAAAVDGAGRWHRLRHVTLPGIMPTIILMTTLSLGSILNAGFEQVLTLYNPVVYSSGDIIDTYVYRVGLLGTNYELATVIGIFKSLVSFILILVSYWAAGRFANYRIF